MRSNILSTGLNCAVMLLVLTTSACRNPPPKTAASAHGNTDWHIDTANEFLFGVDNSGNPSADNHAPVSWDREHLHVGKTNTGHFYFDSAKASPGDDLDADNGIDKDVMLFFYAGHGSATSWSTLGDSGTQSKMRLGNNEGSGRLRYYWQCSCDVFAHGPESGSCGTSDFSYACPGEFDGSDDSFSMRNVYQRWGPALGDDLRMACGVSTLAYCHESQTNKIWDDFNNKGYDVSDSFIDGLDTGTTVPLCITKGGSNVTQTPLFDHEFTNQFNSSGTSYYYIQYLGPPFRLPPIDIPIERLPEFLPIWELKPLALPETFADLPFETSGGVRQATLSSRDEQRGHRQVRILPASGAVYVKAEIKSDVGAPTLTDEAYVDRARQILVKLGIDEPAAIASKGGRFMIARVPVGSVKELKRQPDVQKNVTVTFQRQIAVDEVRIPVLGEGGQIAVQLNNDGTLRNLAKVWRQVAGVKREARVKRPEQARDEAMRQIRTPEKYKVHRMTWGYQERAGNVVQKELRFVYRFELVPVEPRDAQEFPPQIVEVQGQEE